MKKHLILLLLFIKLFLTVNVLFANSEEENINTENPTKIDWNGEPVIVFGDTLFYIKTKIGSFTPAERAKSIAKRIENIYDDYSYNSTKIKVVADENDYAVLYGDVIIVSVNPEEAEANNINQRKLAIELKEKIIDRIELHRKETSINFIFKEIGLALLLIFSTFFAIKFFHKLYQKLTNKIFSLIGTKTRDLSIKSYQFLNEEQILKISSTVLKIVKTLVILILLYISFLLLFSIFPITYGIANTLLEYVLNPAKKILLKVFNFIPNLITILVIIFVFKYVIKVLQYFSNEIKNEKIKIKGFYADLAIPTFHIVRVLLVVFMLIIIFPYLPGSETPIFRGVSIFFGIIISLGSTNLIGNAVAGLVLTYMRPFQIGDRIKIGELIGNVIEKTPFVVRIKTPKFEEISIPNSNVLSANIVNYTVSAANSKVAIYLSVTIGYDVPWRQIYQLLLDAAAKTDYVLKEPKPFVLQTDFNDFYVNYQINAFIFEVDLMPAIYSKLRENIQDVFNEAGIEILSKHIYSIDCESGNSVQKNENKLEQNDNLLKNIFGKK